MHILCLWLTKVFVFTFLLVGGVLLLLNGWGLAAKWSGLRSSNSSTWWCPLAHPMAGLCPGCRVICSRWQSFHHCRYNVWNICSSQGVWALIICCSSASSTTLSSLSWSRRLLRLGCFLHGDRLWLVPWLGPSLWGHHYSNYTMRRLRLLSEKIELDRHSWLSQQWLLLRATAHAPVFLLMSHYSKYCLIFPFASGCCQRQH